MNRQRRLEAIARRRALIDSHLHMLSSANAHEMRVPNIIRSRTGRMRERERPTVLSTNVQSVVQSHNGNVNSVGAAAGGNNVSAGESGGRRDVVPVDISEKIASIIASNNGDILKSFQTIQTEDGTVMVVLEDEVINLIGEGQDKTQEEPSGPEPVDVQSQSQPGYVQGAEDQHEECYVIVQSEDGNEILVPGSVYSQTQIQVPEKKFKAGPSTKKVSNANATRIGLNNPRGIKSKQNCSSSLRNVSKVGGVKKSVKPKMHGKTESNLKISRGTLGINDRMKVETETSQQEKPRPFRFELPPELEREDPFSDLPDNFLSVPVPLKIDSIRSETDTSTNYKAKKINPNDSVLSCSKCSETFPRPLELLQHVKLVHTNRSPLSTTRKLSPVKSEVMNFNPVSAVSNVTLKAAYPATGVMKEPETPVDASQCVQSIPCITSVIQEDTSFQNTFSVPSESLGSGTYTITTDEEGTVYLQLAEENVAEDSYILPNNNDVNSNVEIFQNQNYVFDGNEESLVTPTTEGLSVIQTAERQVILTGTRTVSKATAKASIVKSENQSSDNNGWIVQNVQSLASSVSTPHNYVIDYDDNSIRVQPAKIGTRNVSFMLDPQNQQLSNNFKSIFQQVTLGKQDATFFSQ